MTDHAFVVLAYKISPFLPDCLETLSMQTAKGRIVVSTSTPNAFIEAQAAKFGLELIVNPHAEGIAADWNFGLRAAGTRYVTLAHQDDTYNPEFLASSMEVLRAYEGALAFTGYQEIDDDRHPVSSKISRVKHLIEATTLGGVRRVPPWRMRAFLSFGAPLPCSSVTYDLEKLDGFEFSSIYLADLDWDAWLRLLDMEKQFVRDPRRLVGRRHNRHTATSQLIADGSRRREDLILFRRIWPRPLADAIALAYRAGY